MHGRSIESGGLENNENLFQGGVMGVYAIKNWYFNPQPKQGEPSVLINGRAPGLIGWLLSLVRIDPTVSLRIDGSKICFDQGSLSGFERVSTIAQNICSTEVGYKKPWKEAIVIGIVLGVPTLGIGCLIGLIYYFLNKRVSIGFTLNSGRSYSVDFKRSIIENKNIDENAAAQICAFMDWLACQR
jgi:hypothetical protein